MKQEPSGARLLPANPLAAGLVAGEATADRITWIELSLIFLPLTVRWSRFFGQMAKRKSRSCK